MYIQDPHASVTRPIRELKGYQLIELEAGVSKELTFVLTEKELGFYNNQGKWLVESGDFNVFLGGSSAAQLSGSFELK